MTTKPWVQTSGRHIEHLAGELLRYLAWTAIFTVTAILTGLVLLKAFSPSYWPEFVNHFGAVIAAPETHAVALVLAVTWFGLLLVFDIRRSNVARTILACLLVNAIGNLLCNNSFQSYWYYLAATLVVVFAGRWYASHRHKQKRMETVIGGRK